MTHIPIGAFNTSVTLVRALGISYEAAQQRVREQVKINQRFGRRVK